MGAKIKRFVTSNFFQIWMGSLIIYFDVYLFTLALDFRYGGLKEGVIQLDRAAVFQVVTALSRSLGQFFVITLTCISIALPVTANLYTPRLIKLFMTDPLNLMMLGIVLLTLSHNIWAHFALRHVESMRFVLYFTIFLFFLSLSTLIGYFRHMAKYFNPSFLLHRIEQDVKQTLALIHRTEQYRNTMRIQILIQLDNIGNMVLKSILRSDREVALAGIQALRELLDEYVELKNGMPAVWMELDYSRFPGMSTEGLTEVNRRKIWFELLILRDCLEESLTSITHFKPPSHPGKKWFVRKAEQATDLSSLVEGSELLLRRLDGILLAYEVTPMPVVGEPFAPDRMRAVQKEENPDVFHGIVLAEIRKGFYCAEEVFRTAEVIVNHRSDTNE